ncbi:hypothetical protein PCE1_003185 [Barthelona sp. PCE]
MHPSARQPVQHQKPEGLWPMLAYYLQMAIIILIGIVILALLAFAFVLGADSNPLGDLAAALMMVFVVAAVIYFLIEYVIFSKIKAFKRSTCVIVWRILNVLGFISQVSKGGAVSATSFVFLAIYIVQIVAMFKLPA